MQRITSKKIEKYTASKHVFHKEHYKQFNKFLLGFTIIGIVVLFLPWTQNITGYGKVTTLKLNQRPQTIQSHIPGRIEEWFVHEGDFVNKGDTILRISEIKSDYFDEQLASRTNEQLNAKNASVNAYESKVIALKKQISALRSEQILKQKQTENKLTQSYLKIKSDSIDLEAAKTNAQIAFQQYNRALALESEGLKAVKDVEAKKLKLRETQAKLVYQENKLLSTRNENINAQIEVSNIKNSYLNKVSKAESDLQSAITSTYNAKVEVSKLESSYTNYLKRNNLLYITSPQNGYINKAIIGGLGVTFKEGEELVGIMPSEYDLAVETFVQPIDLPLIHIDEKVRIQFDGWPAIVFNGWPNISYGTYGAKVIAIENFISNNGKYRILLAPDENDHTWPTAIRIGSGARTIALLEDVPIWYELWRQLNNFPPNYYQPFKKKETKEK